MRRTLVFITALMLPMQAAALSCVAPSLARTWATLDAAPESYVVVEGRLALDNALVPKSLNGTAQPPELTHIPAALTGKSLGKAGFRTPFEQAVTLDVHCFGPWCGTPYNGMEVLAFVRQDADGYVLRIDPCGGHVFENRAEERRQAEQCFTGGPCEATR